MPNLDQKMTEMLNSGQKKSKFALKQTRIMQRVKKDRVDRKGVKRFIKPENSDIILSSLPMDEGERTHCVLRGDFVLCSMLPRMIALTGPCSEMHIATLGLRTDNAKTLCSMIEAGSVGTLSIHVSNYFRGVNKASTYKEVVAQFAAKRPKARMTVSRQHAKVILMYTPKGYFTIEGSANLRSSDNLEQIVIFNDRETFDFHREWMRELEDKHGNELENLDH